MNTRTQEIAEELNESDALQVGVRWFSVRFARLVNGALKPEMMPTFHAELVEAAAAHMAEIEFITGMFDFERQTVRFSVWTGVVGDFVAAAARKCGLELPDRLDQQADLVVDIKRDVAVGLCNGTKEVILAPPKCKIRTYGRDSGIAVESESVFSADFVTHNGATYLQVSENGGSTSIHVDIADLRQALADLALGKRFPEKLEGD